jgi:hypothetical protein
MLGALRDIRTSGGTWITGILSHFPLTHWPQRGGPWGYVGRGKIVWAGVKAKRSFQALKIYSPALLPCLLRKTERLVL